MIFCFNTALLLLIQRNEMKIYKKCDFFSNTLLKYFPLGFTVVMTYPQILSKLDSLI